jgi:hypothetical protein
VKFYFRATVAGTPESLALGSLYTLADDNLKTYGHGALNVFEYEGEDSLVVIKVDSIISAVAMVPFKRDEGGCRVFLVEKCALGVIDSNASLDLEE